MTKVLVTSRSFGSGEVDLVAEATTRGYEIVRGPSHHSLDQLGNLLASAEAWIAGAGPIASEHLALAKNLKIIARYGVGVDMVDLEQAARRGVVVTNTPGANTEAVADLTVGLMLASLRHLAASNRAVREGDWSARVGRELRALSVGLVGFGRIGQSVARRLAGFGTSVSALDPAVDVADRSSGAITPVASLEELFSRSDLVSLHAPGGQLLVDSQVLAHAKPGMVLVNTARAELVDEQAVAEALRTGSLAGYAADSVDGDTGSHDSPLLASDLSSAVTLTPHIGAQTRQAIDTMGQMALDNVHAVLTGQPPLTPVARVQEKGEAH